MNKQALKYAVVSPEGLSRWSTDVDEVARDWDRLEDRYGKVATAPRVFVDGVISVGSYQEIRPLLDAINRIREEV